MDISKIYYEPWKIIKPIGQGTFGTVYEIQREEFGETYKAALKVISIPQSESEIISNRASGMDNQSMSMYYSNVVQELTHEFALLSKVKGHTNIVGYEDHKVIPHENGIGWDIYIRMELLTSLTTVSASYHFSRNEVIKLGIDICEALAVCQNKAIIHRDIKPDNIFISENGDFELGDFGFARTASKTSSMYNMSRKGTLNYMAPEVYKNQPYNSTVDIYSLGVVLYQLMNNKRLPFIPVNMSMSDAEEALGRRMSGEQLPVPEEADSALAKVILKACAYNPNDRYSSAEELKNDLIKLLNGEIPKKIDIPLGTMRDTIESEPNNSLKKEEKEKKKEVGEDMKKEEQKKSEAIQITLNKKMIIGIIGAIVLVIIIAIIFMVAGDKKEKNKAANTTAETTTEAVNTEKEATTEATKLTDNLNDFIFELEDITYKLPIAYKDFVDTGWSIPEDYSGIEETELKGKESGWMDMTNGDERVEILIYNASGDTRKIKECNICGIKVSKENDVDFKIAGGITVLSTVDEVEEKYGIPSDSYKGDDYTVLTYNVNEDVQNQYTEFTIYNNKDNYDYNTIELRYKVATEGDITKVSNEAPKYLSQYKEPLALSEDATETIFELDDHIYQLPCPVTEFTDNGWKIVEKNVDSIPGKQYETYALTIEKGNIQLKLNMMNFDKKSALVENCAVYGMEFYSSDLKEVSEGYLKFSGNLTLYSSAKKIEKASGKFDKSSDSYEDMDSVSFTYYNSENTKNVRYYISISPGEDEYRTVTLSNAVWKYE